ncbi:hypothetical protein OTU49_010509, partial [Cherax quadricarinatus]
RPTRRPCPSFSSCPRIYNPVCGSDGRNYRNQCYLNIAMCVDRTLVKRSNGIQHQVGPLQQEVPLLLEVSLRREVPLRLEVSLRREVPLRQEVPLGVYRNVPSLTLLCVAVTESLTVTPAPSATLCVGTEPSPNSTMDRAAKVVRIGLDYCRQEFDHCE